MTLILNTTMQLFHKILWFVIMYYQTKFGKQMEQQFRRYSRNCHILIIWALAMTLTLKIANQSFCMTLRLMMMHQNTVFGNKMFGGLEDIIWRITNILTLHCDLDFECSNPFFSQNTLAHDNVSLNQVWLPRNQQFRRYCRKSQILIIWALSVTLTLKITN